MIQLTYAAFVALTLTCLLGIVVWLRQAMPRMGLAPRRQRSAIMVSLIAVLGWLVVTMGLALSGFFAESPARPPRVMLVPLVGFASVVALNLTPMMRRLLQVTPRHWPVAMQSFRIGVELTLWCCFLAGLAPVQTTFEGRNYDVFVGLSAPIVALLIAKLKLPASIILAWNSVALLILGNTLFTVLTSVPGPLHRDWPGEPFVAFATWPIIWLPAFLAPFAVALHVFSIRQNLAGHFGAESAASSSH